MTTIFDTSTLYNLFLMGGGDEDEIKNLFLNKIKDFGLNEDEITGFLNDYKTIQYNEKNILNYVSFVSYFQYSIKDNFFDYITKHYVFDNLLFLDILVNTIVVNKIEEHCGFYKWRSNEQLLYISKYISIKDLNLEENKIITDKGIKNLTNIHTLNK